MKGGKTAYPKTSQNKEKVILNLFEIMDVS